MKKEKSTKKLQCRCKNCTNIVEVAKTSLSVVCSLCTLNGRRHIGIFQIIYYNK